MKKEKSPVYEIRFHGRGGQGSVSAAAVLALAAFENGFQTQAFPKFGSERRGAPVEAYVRISNKSIRAHTQIYDPDTVIIQDATLIQSVSVLQGLKPHGLIILNGEFPFKNESQAENSFRWICLPASQIAQRVLGRPLPNTALLGAFAAVSDYVDLGSLKKAITNHLAKKGEDIVQANIRALEDGFKAANQQQEALKI